jgi:hypothetical protein
VVDPPSDVPRRTHRRKHDCKQRLDPSRDRRVAGCRAACILWLVLPLLETIVRKQRLSIDIPCGYDEPSSVVLGRGQPWARSIREWVRRAPSEVLACGGEQFVVETWAAGVGEWVCANVGKEEARWARNLTVTSGSTLGEVLELLAACLR